MCIRVRFLDCDCCRSSLSAENRSVIVSKAKIITAVAAVFVMFSSARLFAYSDEVGDQSRQLRVQIWSELDDFPGDFGDNDGQNGQEKSTSGGQRRSASDANGQARNPLVKLYSFAISRAKEIAPFFMGGMLSGWSFDYVPYDKSRGVKEFFEYSPLTEYNAAVNPIDYRDPEPRENKLLVWTYCDRTETQQLSFKRWNSINLPKVRGRGTASVEKGMDGIKEAVGNAIKDGVRQHWRLYSRNKPKEIIGSVLLIGIPRVYILEGQYVTDLEFFLETDKIVKYTYY